MNNDRHNDRNQTRRSIYHPPPMYRFIFYADGLPRGLAPGFLTRPAKKFASAWLWAFSSPADDERVSFL